MLKIKQAECALNDGRLDEALEIALTPEVRRHHRGQQLLTRLAHDLLERAQRHLADHRLPDALADCQKARKLAGSSPPVSRLHQAITQALAARQNHNQLQAEVLAQARQQLHNGSLSDAQHLLTDELGDHHEATQALARQVAIKRKQMDTVIQKAHQALLRDDLETAVDLVAHGDLLPHRNTHAAQLLTAISAAATRRIRAAIDTGRLDQAHSLLQRVAPLMSGSLEFEELTRLDQLFRSVRQALDSDRPEQAARLLRQLQALLPSIPWLAEALKNAQFAADALEALRTGPLSWITPDPPDLASHQNHHCAFGDTIDDQPQPSPHQNSPDLPWPDRFVIRIDQVGSFLVLQNPQITLGPISAPEKVDLGLIAEPHLPIAALERTDDDYFLRSAVPVDVNGQPTRQTLLNHNDRIGLSPRCTLKFLLPNAASATAVLDLTGARLAHADIRRVILLDREIIIGGAGPAHIPTGDLPDTKLVLFIQDGKLRLRTNEPVTVKGNRFDRQGPVPLDTPITIGSLTLVLTQD